MRNLIKITTLIILVFLGFSSQAKQIEVCSTCNFKSLKKAIEFANNGDEIILKKGIYYESDIIITKPIIITGNNLPVIDGGGLTYIFQIKSDSVTISGLTLQNVQTSYSKDLAAIHIYKSNHFKISNNNIRNIFFGVLVEKSKFGEVSNNIISSNSIHEYNSGNGIHLWNSDNVIINDNNISGMRDGIYFEFVKNSTVFKNYCSKNIRYGLHFMFSNENEYYDNTFTENAAGVAVMFSKYIKMYSNKFIKNWGTASYGVLLKEIYDAELTDNIFDENTIGINAEGCTRINYKTNTFIKNGWAVKISGACYSNKFIHNNFISNAFNLSYSGRMNDNEFNSNYWDDYSGYDIDKNGIGDVAYRPVKLFSYIVNKTPESIVLLRSLFVDIINFSEKVSPIFTPDDLLDNTPLMKQIK